MDSRVLTLDALDCSPLQSLLGQYGLRLTRVAPSQVIPGSYWGDPEAGLKGSCLYARLDTPVHSVLHEGAHYICMTAPRRAALDTDAGGDETEENAACYMQILLAGELADVGRVRMCRDMDDWGYTFRLGSAAAWFCDDADEVRQWLEGHGLIDGQRRVTYACRGTPAHRISMRAGRSVTAARRISA
jgi:hypothetical protein